MDMRLLELIKDSNKIARHIFIEDINERYKKLSHIDKSRFSKTYVEPLTSYNNLVLQRISDDIDTTPDEELL